MAEPVETFRAAVLADIPHAFFGRRGGVSTGIVAGLNAGLGAEDDDAAVMQNRALASAAVLPTARLVTPYQVHSADAVIVRQAWELADRPRADALVTDRPGILLGIVTADCAPVLFVDSEAGVVGAAHAGWRGAHDGIVEAAVAAMEELGAHRTRIRAAIGPCIAQTSYEVDQAFRGNFSAEDACFFTTGRTGHFQFDLESYVAMRLARCDISAIEPLGLDTYVDDSRFYSYRRATHQVQAAYGRQISIIGLPAI